MRLLSALAVLFGGLSFIGCSNPSADTSTTPAPVRKQLISSNSGSGPGIVPGPDPAHRSVRPEDVLSQDTMYAATLPVLNDENGAIRLRVVVNPQTHTIEKTTAIFAPHRTAVTYNQLGDGTPASAPRPR
ncbi:MAG TPA: hypothetical protein VF629_10920 [Hymenobacter sp.]|uniref:hypothetical protein n=1 Tax=Hymenobacter sp. TaxID=1898978 RepID=UPI002ED9F69F